MKSRKKQKRSGGESNPESCKETKLKFVCPAHDHGKTKFCQDFNPNSVCYSEKCYTPANCIYQDPTETNAGKSGSNNLINSVVGVAGLGAMYMGYKWLNKKKSSSDDSSSPEKRKSSRRKRKSSHLKSISHR